MRAIIRNMSEMTDSREMLEAKTHPVIVIFVSILMFIILVAFVWTSIGEMDEVAKASGVVRPNDKVSNIQAQTMGMIKELNVKEGQFVNEGDLLVSFEQEGLLLDQQLVLQEKDDVELELSQLKRYSESIQTGTNLFSESDKQDALYLNLVKQYLLEYAQKESDFQTTKLSIEQGLTESELLLKTNRLSQNSMNKKYSQSRQEYEKLIKQAKEDLSNEKALLASIQAKENKLLQDDTVRMDSFNKYLYSFNELSSALELKGKKVETSQQLGDRFVSKSQLEQEQTELELLKQQLKQFQSETELTIQTRIKQYEEQLQKLSDEFNVMVGVDSLAELDKASLALEEDKLTHQYDNIIVQQSSVLERHGAELEKFKLDRIVQIELAIDEKQSALQQVNNQLYHLKLAIDKQNIKAPISGTVHMLKTINVGDIVQPSEAFMSIIPQNESMYKLVISVPNHEVGKIAVGQEVNMNVHAFPKQSFGSLSGTVNSISTDSYFQQDGRSYYNVEATIANTPLINRKGESGELRVGMTAETYVVTNSKKIIHFLLEKINLRD